MNHAISIMPSCFVFVYIYRFIYWGLFIIQEIRNERRREQDGTLEDIERLSAVYTGFAEENKDQLTSIGIAMGDTLQKILKLDHENKKLKVRV